MPRFQIAFTTKQDKEIRYNKESIDADLQDKKDDREEIRKSREKKRMGKERSQNVNTSPQVEDNPSSDAVA